MKYSETNKPIVCMQTQSTCYKKTIQMQVKGVLWHSTGSNNPYLKRYIQPSDNAPNKDAMLKILGVNSNKNDWNHIYREAGLNCWIGKLADGTVTTVQTMPWNYRPWGCGQGKKGSCNSGWIQFEICEDSLTDASYFDKVYKEACEITAYLCKLYKIDPHGAVTMCGIKIPTILCHNDSYKLGFGSGHSDVEHWFPKFGKSMQTVRDDVAKLMTQKVEEEEVVTYEQWKGFMDQYRKELGSSAAADYAKPYIKECVDAGIMVNAGTPDSPSIERPGDFLTRQEAAVMHAQALKHK